MSEAAILGDGLNTAVRGYHRLGLLPAAQNRRVDVVFSNASGQFSEAALSRHSAIRR